MNVQKLIIKLRELNACKEAIEWLSSQTTLEQAWENCTRGDWLLWLVAALRVDERKLSLAKGLVAKEITYLMDDKRSKTAVQAAIDYGKNEISRNELEKAALAADDADAIAYADANAAIYVAFATDAAATAADADAITADVDADAAAHVADAAAYVATIAADAAADFSSNSNDKKLFLEKSAKIVKKIFSFDDLVGSLNGKT